MPFDTNTQPSFDALVQEVRDIREQLQLHRHTGWDLSQKLFNTPISSASLLNAMTLGDGQQTSGTLTLKRASGFGSVYILGGTMVGGDFANTNAKTGFIIGEDDADGKDKFYFGSSTAYIKYDGTTLTVVGSLTVSKLDIPDTTTASSFHVDTSGNSWWGANVASGISAANASITSAGLATFKNILVGGATIQYTMVNGGMFSFGDGNDGAGVADGVTALAGATLAGSTYTLTRNVYYTDLTVSTGVTVKPAGYQIFGTGTLTLNGTALIQRNGNAGGDGVPNGGGSGAKGAGGAALADGYLKGSVAGGTGGSLFDSSAGTAGANTSNSIGSSGSAGSIGGVGSGTGATAGGAGGTATASNVRIFDPWSLTRMVDIGSTGSTIKYDNSAGAGGGGGGGNGSSNNGGTGGGGGSAGGIIAIYFRNIVIGASASITASGGAAGKGGNGASTCGGGGGGGGGNGGQIILVYNTISNSGSVTASAGAAGAKGTGGGAGGLDGTDGAAGTAGTVRQFIVSM